MSKSAQVYACAGAQRDSSRNGTVKSAVKRDSKRSQMHEVHSLSGELLLAMRRY